MMLNKPFFYENNTINVSANYELFIEHSAQAWIQLCNQCITDKGSFFVALSGGSTPQAIYKKIVNYKHLLVDTSKIFLFWSDERCVPLTDPESNYYNAMIPLQELDLPEQNIFPMPAELASPSAASNYETSIIERLSDSAFDLIMLGLGDDGHTASLFPQTKGLHETQRLVIINEVPQKKTHRMTMTFPCLQKAHNISIYVAGSSKAVIIKEIFIDKKVDYPMSYVLSNFMHNTWFMDQEAGKALLQIM